MSKKAVNQINYLFENYISAAKQLQTSYRFRLGNKAIDLVRSLAFRKKQENLFIGQMTDIENKLQAMKNQFKEPELIKNFNNSTSAVSVATDLGKFDVIIPVHNALSDVKKCLDSVIEDGDYGQLIIVNDGSDEETSSFLLNFAENADRVKLIHHKESKGYTVSVNAGIDNSQNEFLITLNSDTIVPKGWLKILSEAFENRPQVAVFGPLSNAASYQSVPVAKDNNDWFINDLPENLSLNQFNALIYKNSLNLKPRVPFINGFCFAIRRNVLNEIGGLDAQNFPRGYGEENDLCYRVQQAGYELRILDNLYVFHSKSKSFGHSTRKELARKGRETLHKLYGEERLKLDIESMESNPDIYSIRDQVANLIFSSQNITNQKLKDSTHVAYLLPVKGGSGGAHSVIQEAVGMRQMGVLSYVLNKINNKTAFIHNYADILEEYPDIFVYYNEKDENDLENKIKSLDIDVLIATIFNSARTVKSLCEKITGLKGAYYVQDYEPLFFEESDPMFQEAKDSYEIMQNHTLFAKTDWIRNEVKKHHGVEVVKVSPSIDHSVYHPINKKNKKNSKIIVSAMIRPSTPRRGALRTLEILKKLVINNPDLVEIKVFGSEFNAYDEHNLPRDFEFTNLGFLTRNEVAELLQESDIFIDLSDYQAFGRTGLEAMACGCVPVLPKEGGVYEYATANNSIIVNPFNEEDTYEKIEQLVKDENRLTNLKKNTVSTSLNYSVIKAAWSEIEVLVNNN